MEDDQIVAAARERSDRLDDGFRPLVEVGDQHQDPTTAEGARHREQRVPERSRATRMNPLQGVQHQVHVTDGGPYVLHYLGVERVQPHPVTLAAGKVGQRGGQEARVVELADGAAAVGHGARYVEEHGEVGVRLRLVLLDIMTVRAREQPPVDLADVIARYVGAVLRELHRQSQIGRAVEPVQKAVHHRACEELEVIDPRQHHRIEEAGPRRIGVGLGTVVGHLTSPTSGPALPPGACRSSRPRIFLRIRRGSSSAPGAAARDGPGPVRHRSWGHSDHASEPAPWPRGLGTARPSLRPRRRSTLCTNSGELPLGAGRLVRASATA